MLVLATLLLGLGSAQVAEIPFQMDLPAGYPAFAKPNPQEEAWTSIHEDGTASYEIRHFLLESPGAVTTLVAENIRKTRWKPMLTGVSHTLKPWLGKWAEADAAGSSIEYSNGEEQRYLEQRLLVLDEHLIIANWEGQLIHKQAAEKALASFHLPDNWKAAPPLELDIHRGMQPKTKPAPPLGHFEIEIDASEATFKTVDFKVIWKPADGIEARGKDWRLPQGAILQSATSTIVEYRIPLYEGTRPSPKAGLLPGAFGLSGLGGAWLALPTGFAPTHRNYSPPPFTIEILIPPFLEALSGTAVDSKELLDGGSTKRIKFKPNLAPKTWPYFVVGMYQFKKIADRTIALRRSSKAIRIETNLRFMNRLQEGCSDWLPNARKQWSITSFPGSGDLIFPGLFVFDEASGWLDEPLDAVWIEGNRRAGLARKMAYHVFGRQLAGIGNGAVFLDASLSEYAAWRILESAGLLSEADAMRTFWKSNEDALGKLPLPLTLMPLGDLQGGRRLMTRGALVWLAIEKRAGRLVLDKILNSKLDGSGFWSTEDLRLALEKHCEDDWLPFFQAHVYGRKHP